MSHKPLLTIKKKHSGRDSRGHVSVRHQGGQQKRFLREIEWNRNRFDVPAKVVSIEYDPNRTSDIALLVYENGAKSYILSTFCQSGSHQRRQLFASKKHSHWGACSCH